MIDIKIKNDIVNRRKILFKGQESLKLESIIEKTTFFTFFILKIAEDLKTRFKKTIRFII